MRGGVAVTVAVPALVAKKIAKAVAHGAAGYSRRESRFRLWLAEGGCCCCCCSASVTGFLPVDYSEVGIRNHAGVVPCLPLRLRATEDRQESTAASAVGRDDPSDASFIGRAGRCWAIRVRVPHTDEADAVRCTGSMMVHHFLGTGRPMAEVHR